MDDSLATTGSSSSEDDDRRRSKKKKAKKKQRKKRYERKKKSKKRKHASDEDSSSSESRRRSKKRKKKHRKESKRAEPFERNYQLAEALYSLLKDHPPLADDLPILLVRLASGSTLDFRSMTHRSAAAGLNTVLATLTPYGVVRDGDDGAWKWHNPSGSTTTDERILVRVVRSLLNDIGFTVGAVDAFGKQPEDGADTDVLEETEDAKPEPVETIDTSVAEALVVSLLRTFGKAELAAELVGLCDVILSGEAICLEGLPDEKLRTALEEFFRGIDLEETEMENDDEEAPSIGYCLPESIQQRVLVESVQEICRKQSSKLMLGPLPRPSNYNASDDEDDDGPLLKGQVRTTFASASAAAEVDPAIANGNGREEWMLVPGKHTFLSALKSKPLKNRQFSGKSVGPVEASAAVDPKIQQEIDALRQAHEESRGPSLMDEHQKHKAAKAQAKAGDANWKWDRDTDLDSGRRVDKDALHMMLGGAGQDLKSKFQSSY